MNANSHKQIAVYLDRIYLKRLPRQMRKAFIIGCIEPDKNPTTYIKGSLRNQWLRGHNWENAQRYILKIADGLDRKSRLNIFEFYKLGKLIHYTADAFTYAHNLHFQSNLKVHRQYERALDRYIEKNFKNIAVSLDITASSILDIILSCRISYMRTSSGIIADTLYAKQACCSILSYLSARDLLCYTDKLSSSA